MQLLIKINENVLFYTILKSVISRKLKRIGCFNVQLNKKG